MTQQIRRKLSFIYWISISLAFIFGFLYWFIAWSAVVYTDDAYVGGNQIYITPLHPGFVTSIHTDDTHLVKKGELLVKMDKTNSLIAFDRAQAQLAESVREVCQLFHQVFVYQSEIESSKARFIEAAQDFQHRWGVLPANAISLEEYEHATASLRISYFNLQTNETLYNKALSIVQGTTIEDHPLIRAAADKMKEARLDLYRCNIYAPEEGLIAQRSIQVGMWTHVGTPLMSLIPLDQIWVNANFKETQLRSMKIGQRVKITSDLYGRHVVYEGTIVGLPGLAGNATSLLPPQNLSGNWIKIVQRLPVRIKLEPEQLKKYPLRIGLSLEATVDLSDPSTTMQSANSPTPLYQTTIFEQEGLGDQDLINQIISLNLDPTLIQYRKQTFNERQKQLLIPTHVQAALFTNPESPFHPPLPFQMMAETPPSTQVIEEKLELTRDTAPTSVNLECEEVEQALKGFSLPLLIDEVTKVN